MNSKALLTDERCIKLLVIGEFPDQSLQLIFTDQRFRVTGCFISGEDALNHYHPLSADVVIVQHQLPGMTGCETARFMKEQMPQIEVVVVSDKLDIGLFLACSENKIHAYVDHRDDANGLSGFLQSLLFS